MMLATVDIIVARSRSVEAESLRAGWGGGFTMPPHLSHQPQYRETRRANRERRDRDFRVSSVWRADDGAVRGVDDADHGHAVSPADLDLSEPGSS
jgi:hypothetical protein